jgi:hypothetical protein
MTPYADPRRKQHIAMVVIIRARANMRWTLPCDAAPVKQPSSSTRRSRKKIIQMDEGTKPMETHPAKMKVAVLALFMLAASGPWAAVNAQSSPQSQPASTNADVGQQRIDEVFTKPRITPDYFASSYLEHNTQAKIEGIVKDLKSTLGDYKSVKKSTDKNDPPFDNTWERYTAVFAKGVDDVYIHFDDSGKVDALTFRAPRPGGT